METVNQKAPDSGTYVQDVAQSDLPWNVRVERSLCLGCGACVAVCSRQALEFFMPRRPAGGEKAPRPAPAVRQKTELSHSCSGCGMCARVCPNGALSVEANPRHRAAFLSRCAGVPRRGGRAADTGKRTLDGIVVGRISQMTDPALDAERHTFDLRAPFGRVLLPGELPLTREGESLRLSGEVPPLRWIYPLIFSDMSIGALSPRAWEALILATACLNEEHGLPVRMCTGEGGVPGRLLESERLNYLILQIASGHFGWNRIIQAMPRMKADPAGILIKVGQGAKPGDGGLLPAAKVAPHIQAIRGVPGATLHSPPTHQGLYSIEEAVQKMHLSLNAAFGFRVPVAIKCAASATSVAVYNNLLRDPYRICGGFFLDGIQGGTGAAHEVSLDHTGHPILSKLRDCFLSASSQGRQGTIPLWAGGGVGQTGQAAADMFKMICLGANGVFVGRLLLQLMGCVGDDHGRCNLCATGQCPAGICTQDPRLIRRFDIDRAAQRVVSFVLNLDRELRMLMAPVGNSSLPVGRADVLVSTDADAARKLDIAYAC